MEADVQAGMEAQVQVDEQALVEVQVEAEEEANLQAEIEAEVEADVQAEEDDDDNSDYSEVSDSDFEKNWDWTISLDPETFTQIDLPTYQSNEANLCGHDTLVATNPDFVDEDEHSDELDTLDGNDVEADPKV